MKKSPRRLSLSASQSEDFISSIVGDLLHPKRLESLSNAVKAFIKASSAAVVLMGAALATLHETKSKNAVKQIDRLLSNPGLDVWFLFQTWVPYILGSRQEVVIAIDWTDYDRDDQTTIAANVITSHGRATPLIWKTVLKSDLKGKRNQYEDDILSRLSETIPKDVKVTILADRGFSDTKLYRHLDQMGYSFIIRTKGNIYVEDESGEEKQAKEWVAPNGRARMISKAVLTAERYQAASIVTKKAANMKEAWILVTNNPEISAQQACSLYARRFTIEEAFRDLKDAHFGIGLRDQRISRPDRRDRLIFIIALSTALLTLLGAAGENTGIDMHYKVNTVKTRVYSLFRQGRMYFRDMDTMRQSWLEPMLLEFDKLLRAHQLNVLVEAVL